MNSPSLPPLVSSLSSATKRVTFIGQRVTAERTPDSSSGWCVTGWDQGLPVCRRPITAQELAALLQRYHHTQHT
jgi:hypothetical protein